MTNQDKMLQTVTLTIATGPAGPGRDRASAAVVFEFVYGIGAGGLSPFELDLGGRAIGETWRVEIPGAEMGHYFGPELMPIREAAMMLEVPERLSFEFSLTAVREPAPRELVAALARSQRCTSCGCGDSGCGDSGCGDSG